VVYSEEQNIDTHLGIWQCHCCLQMRAIFKKQEFSTVGGVSGQGVELIEE
jgi:hypothetical protein